MSAPLQSSRVVVALLALVAVAAPASAAGGEPGATWLGLPVWVWAWANLLIFWGLLFRLAGPHIRAFFTQRRLQISAELAEARRQREEAEGLRRDLSKKLDELSHEVELMRQRSEEEGERERKQILELAERERERVVEQTKSEIDHRVESARAELVELTARLAADLARERLEREVTAEDRRRLFERNVARLSELKERVS